MAFVEDFSDQSVQLIGVAELLGAIGLIFPAASGIATWLRPAAAGMVLVALTHLRCRRAVWATQVLILYPRTGGRLPVP